MKKFTVANLVLFQVLWLSCVWVAGGMGYEWAAVVAMVPLVILACLGPARTTDMAVALVAAGVGLLLDNIWVVMGLLSFTGYTLAPFWIGFLWFGVGLTLNHSMSWFRDRRVLGPIIVGLFGPITYFSGERLGAVEVERSLLLGLIALAWCALFVLLTHLSRWMLRREQLTDMM